MKKLFLMVGASLSFAVIQPAQALDKEVQGDILMAKITAALKVDKFSDALPYFEEMELLNLRLPESYYFYYIDTLERAGKQEDALLRAEMYLERFGRKGKYYEQVIELIARRSADVDKAKAAREAELQKVREAQRRREEQEAEARRVREEREAAARRQREAEAVVALAQAEERARKATDAAGVAVPSIEAGMVKIPFDTPFMIGKTEVTLKQWRGVMGDDPPDLWHSHKDCDECAVTNVSWADVKGFLDKLNGKTQGGYRLPTVAEWEFACRGGDFHTYCGGSDLNALAWHKGNSGGKVQPVGIKKANGYGLFDMSGNVSEWTTGCNLADCLWRVVRGGSWFGDASQQTAVIQLVSKVSSREGDVGFRLARSLPGR